MVLAWLLHSLDMFRMMAPYLLFGFVLAGLLHALVPQAWVARHLGGHGLGAAAKAAAIGTPLPLCSCGIIPFADLLKRQGASRAAITSFLISTPQTGVDSILAAYAMLGLPLALWKVVTALVSGVIGGTIASLITREGREAATAAATGAEACEGDACETPAPDLPLSGRVRQGLSYGLGMLVEEIAFWLVVGTLAGGAIAAFVPDDFLAGAVSDPHLQMALVLLVAVPLYVCATGSIPVAAALVLKGMPLGGAIVFLIAGPATNLATLTVFTRVLGRRVVAVYLATIVVVSYGFGVLFHLLFPGATLPLAASGSGQHAHGPLMHVAWWEWLATALLGALVLRALLTRARERWLDGGAPADEGDAVARIRIRVEGMTCNHCRGRVEQALEGVDGVEAVEVSLEEGEASVRGQVPVEALIEAVEGRGYSASEAAV